MIKIETQVNDPGVIKMIELTTKKLKSLGPFLDNVGTLLLGSVNKNFEQDGRPAKWTSLAESTIKRRKHGGTKPLQDTGNLKNSMGKVISGNMVSVAPSVTYGIFHQYGTTRIPERPFNMIQDEDMPKIMKIFEHYLGDGAQ